MSDACSILAEVVIEGAAYPATPWYVCTYTGGNAVACTSSLAYNRLLQDPAFKELNKKAAELGCTIAVRAGEEVAEIVVVKGAQVAADVDRAWYDSKRTFRALNTPAGISWLQQYLSGY